MVFLQRLQLRIIAALPPHERNLLVKSPHMGKVHGAVPGRFALLPGNGRLTLLRFRPRAGWRILPPCYGESSPCSFDPRTRLSGAAPCGPSGLPVGLEWCNPPARRHGRCLGPVDVSVDCQGGEKVQFAHCLGLINGVAVRAVLAQMGCKTHVGRHFRKQFCHSSRARPVEYRIVAEHNRERHMRINCIRYGSAQGTLPAKTRCLGVLS